MSHDPRHDPLCPWAQDGGVDIRGECFLIEGSEPPISACELVAKVRADTLDQAFNVAQKQSALAAIEIWNLRDSLRGGS